MAATDVTQALYEVLAAVSGVTDLVGNNIFPDYAPRSASLPRITVHGPISTNVVKAMGSDPGLKAFTMQVSCWAATKSAVVQLGAEVISALQDYSGTVGSVTIQRIFLENRTDIVERHPDAIDKLTHHQALDLLVWVG